MTRAEFAKLVNRTLGFTAESAISFSDVTERDWFYAEVARAVAAGYAQGGGANSIYFDGVRVGGTVRLQKVNVHLRLIGNTALDRVEIGLPCRITRDSPFEGALGTLVIDLEKTSNQKFQIEVPAKLVELLSRANVALNTDVETLQIGKDAEGTQLDIKRGVTVSGSLTVKKTEAEDGAKAPTISGGSSSGGGVTLKEIESIAPITAEVPYGTSALDALAALPAEITLNVKDGFEVKTTAAGWSWADGVCGPSQLRLHLRRRRFHFLLPQRKGRQEA